MCSLSLLLTFDKVISEALNFEHQKKFHLLEVFEIYNIIKYCLNEIKMTTLYIQFYFLDTLP